MLLSTAVAWRRAPRIRGPAPLLRECPRPPTGRRVGVRTLATHAGGISKQGPVQQDGGGLLGWCLCARLEFKGRGRRTSEGCLCIGRCPAPRGGGQSGALADSARHRPGKALPSVPIGGLCSRAHYRAARRNKQVLRLGAARRGRPRGSAGRATAARPPLEAAAGRGRRALSVGGDAPESAVQELYNGAESAKRGPVPSSVNAYECAKRWEARSRARRSEPPSERRRRQRGGGSPVLRLAGVPLWMFGARVLLMFPRSLAVQRVLPSPAPP
jgi:hypothetical protein